MGRREMGPDRASSDEVLPRAGSPPGDTVLDEPTSEKVPRIKDYVSGRMVRATREEREAVQVYSKRLVEDYGYPAKRIQTHPQFRVRSRPSDESRSYPVDIAVF